VLFRSSALRKGETIRVLRNERLFSGAYFGLGADGSLLLEDETGRHVFNSAEIVKIIAN
jgi:hypothetical protein